jgi:hypothetical protein
MGPEPNLAGFAHSPMKKMTVPVIAWLVGLLLAPPAADVAAGAELRPKTLSAFDRYVRVAEGRMAADPSDAGRFLLVDRKPDQERRAAFDRLRAGQVVMERLREREAGRELEAPDALVHHWVGTVFLPGVPVARVVSLMQDYNRHSTLFAPAVVRSKLLSRDGDRFQVALRFHMKKIVSVTVDTDNDARFTIFGPDRVASAIRSVRVQEVEEAGTPGERLKPDGEGGGYLWRLNTYWRYVERDGGTYVQCESISLSRDIPFGFGWLIGPFVTSIPRESLNFTMEALRKALTAAR